MQQVEELVASYSLVSFSEVWRLAVKHRLNSTLARQILIALIRAVRSEVPEAVLSWLSGEWTSVDDSVLAEAARENPVVLRVLDSAASDVVGDENQKMRGRLGVARTTVEMNAGRVSEPNTMRRSSGTPSSERAVYAMFGTMLTTLLVFYWNPLALPPHVSWMSRLVGRVCESGYFIFGIMGCITLARDKLTAQGRFVRSSLYFVLSGALFYAVLVGLGHPITLINQVGLFAILCAGVIAVGIVGAG